MTKGVRSTAGLVLTILAFGVGSASARLARIDLEVDGANGVEGLEGARGVIASPDGADVYAVAILEDALSGFRRNPSTGTLTSLQVLRDGQGGVEGLDGVASLAISPDGLFVYTAAPPDDAIAVFARNPATGVLTFTHVYTDVGTDAGSPDGVTTVIVSPDGRNLYAGTDDGPVIAYSRDASSGLLSLLEVERDGVDGVQDLFAVSSLAVSPDGRNLHVAGTRTFISFTRDLASGTLAFLQSPVSSDLLFVNAAAVAVSPDGNQVYGVADTTGPQVLGVFTRDQGTGLLTALQTLQNGVDGVQGLQSPRAIVVQPDGAYVYTASLFGGVTSFRRNPANGALVFDEVLSDGLGVVFSVAASPDSKQVYAVGAVSNSLVAFGEPVTPPERPVIPALSPFGTLIMVLAFAGLVAVYGGRARAQPR